MAISNRVAIDLRPSQFPADDTPRGSPGPAVRLKKPSHLDDGPTKTMLPPRTLVEPKEIGFYIYPGFSALDLSGPLEVFATSGAVDRSCEYRTILLSRSGGPVMGSGGIEVMTVAASTRTLDTLIVVGASDLGGTNDDDIDAIRTCSATARRTAGVCTGAFLVASTGAADGRRLATHWQSAARLQRDFPHVNVELDRLFVRDGPIWSSAGMTAAIDLALALVEDDYGQDLALAIARNLIMEKRRKGTESQRSQMLELEPSCDRIARVLSYMHRHLSEELTVEKLADVAGLGPRQFGRVFRGQTGETPARAVERLRAEAAKARVDRTKEPIDVIASSVGFANAERMRRAFLRRFGKCPQASRRDQAVSPPLAIVGNESRASNPDRAPTQCDTGKSRLETWQI